MTAAGLLCPHAKKKQHQLFAGVDMLFDYTDLSKIHFFSFETVDHENAASYPEIAEMSNP